MDEQRLPPEPPTPANPPTPVVRRRRGPQLVWLIPLVALLIGGWLAWKTLSERGPTITITFETAEGLEAGKTKVRYRDVDMGTVEGVAVAPDLGSVVVTVRMVKEADNHLNEGTRFWVVRPRLGFGGVSGLGTLVSGAYIGMDPGVGEHSTSFRGLEEPPQVRFSAPGRRFALTADRLGGLGPGAPITYRGIRVGEVIGYEFTPDWQALTVPVFIHAPYDRIVRPNTRFWNASGISVSLGTEGPTVSVESLQSLATGGVAFDTPGIGNPGEAAPEGTVFPLYESPRAASEARFTRRVPFLVHFDGSVRGLHPGSAVEFRGIRVGEVTDIRLDVDPTTGAARIPVTLDLEPERFDAPGGTGAEAAYAGMKTLVDRGLRAQLRTGNLLTGELIVALDYFPDAPQATLEMRGDVPELPSRPNVLDTATRTATDLMEELARAPIAETVTELRDTIQKAGALLGGPEVGQSLASLSRSLAELEKVTAALGTEGAPAIRALRQVAESMTALITQAEKTLNTTDSVVATAKPVTHDLQALVRELTSTARSIRGLTDYLERHPEALIRGKRG
ncbi:intermembrane transport protein PqiB [Azospirillum soli]|uniref:PqiB family protein n=1 Tax=Azospirillum soli TaxID=1304799 RepID=UPI001AE8CF07|nr:MlaD family protein [Azospirillum soli]MBP2316789.1 paraquat-inducible protein B [Azospirillum soli]